MKKCKNQLRAAKIPRRLKLNEIKNRKTYMNVFFHPKGRFFK